MDRGGSLVLRRLAGLRAVLASPGLVAADDATTESQPGVWSTHPRDHPEVDRFVTVAYEGGWVRADFDWVAWSASREALALRDDPEALAAATPDQLARLITVLVRQERFSEASLESAFESGLVLRIVRRAGVLAAQVED